MISDDQLRVAIAYKRTHMSWAAIGRKLGVDKDRLREAANRQGLGDGWGRDSLIRRDLFGSSGHKMQAFLKR
jgi:hypothetical protein